MLIGLAAKNAILIVEYRELQRDGGRSIIDAAIEPSRRRFRPILMTSFAFILGVVPLVLASGAGYEMRATLGIAVFSGMIGVTIFGIFLTPVFYVVIRWLGTKLGVRPPHHLPPPPELAAVAPNQGRDARERDRELVHK